MLKQVLIKAIVPDPNNAAEYTVYLFDEQSNILLPINIESDSAKALTMAEHAIPCARPHIHDTTRRLISSMGASITSAVIYYSKEDIYYAHVRLKLGQMELDVDARVTDAVALAIRFDSDIFVEQEVLDREAIKVTKEIVEKA
ncbi:MAG: bifunctional nuclease family protein [Patescibacteria group bacterium]